MMKQFNLAEALNRASIEREVEDVYNQGISFYFLEGDAVIEHPFACDGYIHKELDKNKVLRLIIEYKFNDQLGSVTTRSKVLVQVLFYLKAFEVSGMPIPNVIMVADKDECFVMHSNTLAKYLD